MKTTKEIISEAVKSENYTINLDRKFTEKQKGIAAKNLGRIINECKKWNGKENEEDTYNPFNHLSRILGRLDSNL